jgi:hypothetical protein
MVQWVDALSSIKGWMDGRELIISSHIPNACTTAPPGYLLARSNGEAEAVLEHVTPLFHECVRMVVCTCTIRRSESSHNIHACMHASMYTHRGLDASSHSLGGSGTPHSSSMMQATAELDGSVDGRNPAPSLAKGACRCHVSIDRSRKRIP